MPDQRRLATLLAFAQILEATAQDDAIDVLDRVEGEGEQLRLRTLRDLDAAALRLRDACLILVDESQPDPQVRPEVFARVPRDQLVVAAARVGELARRADDGGYYERLLGRYSQVRRFLPALLRTIRFQGTGAARSVLDALQFLHDLDEVTRPWRRVVLGPEHVVDRRYYTFCTLERLQDALRRRDVFVAPSERWGDPRAKLLHGPGWESARSQVCRTLVVARRRPLSLSGWRASSTPRIGAPPPDYRRTRPRASNRRAATTRWS